MHSDAICNGLNIARHLIKGAFPLIVVAIVSPTIYAADLLVPSQFQTIQAAIDNAQNGDTVRIAPGLYSERVSIIGKAISVQSNDGARSVTIDAAGTGRCVDVSGVTEGQLRLQGLILQHGSANDFGGGIRVTGSRISLKNCEIYSNRAFQDRRADRLQRQHRSYRILGLGRKWPVPRWWLVYRIFDHACHRRQLR